MAAGPLLQIHYLVHLQVEVGLQYVRERFVRLFLAAGDHFERFHVPGICRRHISERALFVVGHGNARQLGAEKDVFDTDGAPLQIPSTNFEGKVEYADLKYIYELDMCH